ncbi:MAG TPA: glycosyltransferase family 4 protein [Flavobacterium sp.]|jgi:glycosyltransferase involved in cell wall biosynthesis
MAKVIIISQFPLPYSRIGSWTTMYGNYLRQENHQADTIICPRPHTMFGGANYLFANRTLLRKLQEKIIGKGYFQYLTPLKKVIVPGEKYIIQVIDNHGFVAHLAAFLKKNGLASQCYIQFFHHGFGPFYRNPDTAKFFPHIDELVLLTQQSYRHYIDYYTVMPCKVSVLHNGIDTSKFTAPDSKTKAARKADLQLSGRRVLMWCSQDRPKKGLNLILEVFARIREVHTDIALLVVGSDRKIQMDGVVSVGKIPNNELPEYYQAADVYLFPTLCKEGFGLTLIEALHCGCYCIASALGGVPEVLQNGKLGTLIENPHFVEEWVNAVMEYLENGKNLLEVSKELYSSEQWNKGMNKLIEDAKYSIECRP